MDAYLSSLEFHCAGIVFRIKAAKQNISDRLPKYALLNDSVVTVTTLTPAFEALIEARLSRLSCQYKSLYLHLASAAPRRHYVIKCFKLHCQAVCLMSELNSRSMELKNRSGSQIHSIFRIYELISSIFSVGGTSLEAGSFCTISRPYRNH
jgi:hypothetical protein